jgi:hypothetical protein
MGAAVCFAATLTVTACATQPAAPSETPRSSARLTPASAEAASVPRVAAGEGKVEERLEPEARAARFATLGESLEAGLFSRRAGEESQRSGLEPAVSCDIALMDVAVLDGGLVALEYVAIAGHESALRRQVRERVRRRNATLTRASNDERAAGSAARMAAAIVADTREGARVILLPADGGVLYEVFLEPDLYAHDLVLRREPDPARCTR